jgi:hypothetical protein
MGQSKVGLVKHPELINMNNKYPKFIMGEQIKIASSAQVWEWGVI